MKIYATSDTHFGHDREKVHRPAGFEESILASVKRTTGDILVHCGDFCIGNDETHHKAFLEAAKGFKKKVLVRGNHDGKSDNWYYSQGWDFVCYAYVADLFGKRVLFTHMPIPYRTELNAPYWSPHFEPSINVHGHFHGNNHRKLGGGTSGLYDHNFHYDLAPDIHDFKIVNVESICATRGVLLATRKEK